MGRGTAAEGGKSPAPQRLNGRGLSTRGPAGLVRGQAVLL